MNTETIPDILREMGGITKKPEYSIETMKVVVGYALRLAKAYERELKDQMQKIVNLRRL